MKVGRYTWFYAEPGAHVFAIKATTFWNNTVKKTLESLPLEVEAGKEYYLGFAQNLEKPDYLLTPLLSLAVVLDNPNNNDPLRTRRVFWLVPRETALQQMQRTVYQAPVPD